jgi:long-chain acyl-CoA synthetase
MTLYQMLKQSAATSPNKIALRFEDEVFSYTQLLVLVNRLGHHLQYMGVQPGDRVVLVLPNTPAFIISYFAVTGIGAIAVPINPVWTADELHYIIKDSKAKLVISAQLPAVETIAASIPNIIWVDYAAQTQWQQLLMAGDDSPLGKQVKANDLAVFIYTSGTTGKPKGAMLTHRNLVANVTATTEAIGVTNDDVFLCVLPLFHCLAATVCMLLPIGLGGQIVLMEQFAPKLFVENITNNGVSVLVGVPAMYVVLTTNHIPVDVLKGIRVCISGGAPLPVSVLRRFQKTFGLPIREGYGLSEASPVVAVNRPQLIKPGTIGPPIPGVRVRIVDTDGNDLPLGEAGELLVQGDNVMVGYFGMPLASEQALRDGWLHTGDIASIDSDGYITIVDRLKDMIIVGGLKVYPREVEEVLYTHPKIKEAAVVGVSHSLRGESVKAVISLKENERMTQTEVTTYCKEHLAHYKVPKTVEFLPTLPKSSTGKILRRMVANTAATCG